MAYKIFDKKSTGTSIKSKIKENQQFANELHKPGNSKKSVFFFQRQYLRC